MTNERINSREDGRILPRDPPKARATSLGLNYNSDRAQELRFQQLVKLLDKTTAFSINDYGCGFGSLVTFLRQHGYAASYHGFDLCPEMIDAAKDLFGHLDNCSFSVEKDAMSKADYTVACGIFNLKMDASDAEWREYILATLTELDELSMKGFAFNALTRYSDSDRMRSDPVLLRPVLAF